MSNLENLDNDYDNAEKPETTGFNPLPEGRYSVRVEEARMRDTQKGDRSLSLQFRVITGSHADRVLFKNMTFTAAALSYCKQDLGLLGWKHKLSDLNDDAKRAELLDKRVEVYKKIKDPNPDGSENYIVYINRSLDDATGGTTAKHTTRTAAPTAPVDADDQPPF